MAEASRDLAQGTIEVMVSESVCAKERMEAREVEEAYQKFEESEEHIKVLQIDLSDAVIYLQLDNDCAALIKRNP
ncbi:unnamed protein product [Durusdinium trenchii]|uniref:Uncharacterized protein n=1 Tax=Durusdinium trenchii TaxID=1381693 RepID=A0ABP0NB90_9DINO